MRTPVLIFRLIVVGVFLAAAGAGFVVQGWAGLMLFPFAVAVAAVGLVVGWFILDLVLTYHRHSTRRGNLWARLSRRPTDQLLAIAASPSHPHFAFAVAVLARRGIETKPEKRLLLDMLVSTDDGTRMLGMSFLAAFYPDVPIPWGASSQDPPEVWRERIAAMTAEG